MDAIVAQGKKGISGSALKLIAIFTMLIDHTAASILDHILYKRGLENIDWNNQQAVQKFYQENALLYNLDNSMRLIGRLAFPIFCFLLVEGMIHTHNKWKYAKRLALFAVISEIPFDLAFYGKPFFWGYQNVFFTLFLGMLVMIGFENIQEQWKDKKWMPALGTAGAVITACAGVSVIKDLIYLWNNLIQNQKDLTVAVNSTSLIIAAAIWSLFVILIYGIMIRNSSLKSASINFANMGVLFAGMALSLLLKTDYSAFGILTIAIMYALRKNHFKAMLGGCITLTIMSVGEFTCFFDLILIHFYNGKRGLNLKYIFYLFYPVHLFVLYLICYFMKII